MDNKFRSIIHSILGGYLGVMVLGMGVSGLWFALFIWCLASAGLELLLYEGNDHNQTAIGCLKS